MNSPGKTRPLRTPRGRWSPQRITLLLVLTAVVLTATLAWATTYIYLGGPIGNQGSFAPLGGTTVTFTSDANHTATLADYSPLGVNVVSTATLTATRQLVLPLEQGGAWLVYNNTTGGQAISVGGATGTTVTVANASSAVCWSPDGANFVQVSGGGFDAAVFASPPPLGNVTPNSVYATTLNFQTASEGWDGSAPTNFESAPTTLAPLGWTTVATITPPAADEVDKWSVQAFAADFSGDAGAGVEAGLSTKNVIDCSLTPFTATDPDSGVYAMPPGGTGVWSQDASAPSSLPCVSPTVVLGCTSPTSTAGCTAYASNSSANPVALQYQAVVSSSSVLLQGAFLSDAGPDAAAYPTYRVNATLEQLRRTGAAP